MGCDDFLVANTLHGLLWAAPYDPRYYSRPNGSLNGAPGVTFHEAMTLTMVDDNG